MIDLGIFISWSLMSFFLFSKMLFNRVVHQFIGPLI